MRLTPSNSIEEREVPTLSIDKYFPVDSFDRVTRTPIPAPKRFGSYEVKGELGRGGMGVVYEGYDPILRRSVALKVLIDGKTTDPQFHQRLRTEAEAVAQLQHPHIVHVYEIGWHDGSPFLALENLTGGSLAQVSGNQPMAPQEAARHLRDLAGAIAHAHAQGVVHRDLKPSNVLFTKDGIPKITDFGIAQLRNREAIQDHTVTRIGQIIGTPQYMSPEQAAGNAVGPSADIYSLGAILYELLTGRPPFEDKDPGRLLAMLKEQELIAPSQLRPNLPRDIETICLKCLEKEPHRRYETAEELANDLNRFLIGDPIKARPVSPIRRVANYAKRHPVSAGVSLGIVLAGLFGLSAFIWQFTRTVTALEQARANAEESERQKTEAERHLESANRNLYRGQIAQAQLLIGQSKIESTREMLKATPEGYRNWEWHYLRQLTSDSLWTFSFRESLRTERGQWITRQALNPDGTRLAVVATNPYDNGNEPPEQNPTSLVILNVADGKPIRVMPDAIAIYCAILFWTDNRTLVLVDHSGSIFVRDVDADRWIHTDISTPDTIHRARGYRHKAVNEIGTVMVRTGAYHQVDIIDPLGKAKTRSIPVHADTPYPITISPDGSQISLRGSEPDYGHSERVVDSTTGKTLKYWPNLHMNTTFSPDGKYAFTAPHKDGRCTVTIWDTTTWKPLWCTEHIASYGGGAVFSPDSQRVMVVGLGYANEFHGYDTADGGRHMVFRGHVASIRHISFSPDSRSLASASDDHTVRVWDANSGHQIKQLPCHEHSARTVIFSRDGRSVISGGADEMVIASDLTRIISGGGTVPLPSSGGMGSVMGALGFSPEGRVQLLSTRTGLTQFENDSANPVQRRNVEGMISRDAKEISDYQFSTNGKWLAGRYKDSTVGLWNASTGKMVKSFETGFNAFNCVAISPDGLRIAAAGCINGPNGRNWRILQWDAESGKVLFDRNYPSSVLSLAIAANGRMVIGFRRRVNTEGVAIIFVDATGLIEREIVTTQGKGSETANGSFVNNLTFSRDDRTLAASCMNSSCVILYDADTGIERCRVSIDTMITAMDFSPDGRRLAVTGYTDHISLIDTKTGDSVITIVGATGRIDDWAFPAKVKFSTDGRTLAATHWNGDVSIWHVDSLKATDHNPIRVRDVAGKSAFRFHVNAAEWALLRRDTDTFNFHASQLNRLTPPTEALREDWQLLRLQSDALTLRPSLAGKLSTR